MDPNVPGNSDPGKMHTVVVNMDRDVQMDPVFIISYPSFKMTPLITPENSSGNEVIGFTLVGQVPDPEEKPGSSNSSTNGTCRPARKRVKLGADEYIPTELKAIAKRGPGSQAGPDSSEEEEEVNVLSCEWDDCDEDFTELKMLMSHVRYHVDNELPTVSHEDDERLGEDGYGCLWQDCLFVTTSLSEVVRHINFHTFHTNLKSIGAEIVRKTDIRPCRLDATQRNIVPELNEPFRCLWTDCKSFNSDFPEAIKFYWHVLWHSEEYRDQRGIKGLPCLWRGCTSKPNTVSKLKEHLRSHSQERVVGCPVCGALFSNRSKFFDHCKRQAPPEELNFKCSFCNKYFALERLLRDHMRQHINHHKCSECDMTSPTPSALAAHVAYRHSTEKNFLCTWQGCEYRAKANNDLLMHVRVVHLGENDFRCSYAGCSFRSKAKTTLKHHIENEHKSKPQQYCCHLCTKRFKRGNYLSKHLIAIHKFRWPSGHSRFRYKPDEEGLFHLQTIRFESSELSGHVGGAGVVVDEDEEAEDDPDGNDPYDDGSVNNPASLQIVYEDDESSL